MAVASFGPISTSNSIICILGPPGAGKTTISLQLVDLFGADVVIMSDFLRQLALKDPTAAISTYINDNFKNGTNVDDDRIHDTLLSHFGSSDAANLIVDGFPRTWNGARKLKSWTEANNRRIAFIHVFADLQVCKKRFLAKNLSENAEDIFFARTSHYTDVERPIIDWFSDSLVLDINSG